MPIQVTIRDEQTSDRDAVRAVVESAFGGPVEANLVEALHAANGALIALVAVVDDIVVGHIMFSPMSLDRSRRDSGTKTANESLRLAGLAPMAVAPAFQRSGIGGQLIREGLRRCGEVGLDGVLVLGHANYYPRFGFSRADSFGFRCEYEAPQENFMAVALPGRTLAGVGGLVRYHPAFAAV